MGSVEKRIKITKNMIKKSTGKRKDRHTRKLAFLEGLDKDLSFKIGPKVQHKSGYFN